MIFGYLFTILNYVIYSFGRFRARKEQILFFDLAAKVSYIIGLYLMGSLSGALSMVVTFFYLICANIKERRHYKWPAAYLFFEGMLLLVMIKSFAGISSILMFISSTIALLCVWWLPPQKMRVLGFVGNIISLCYNLSIRNWGGLFEIIVMTSNLTSYLKYRRTAKGEHA